MPAIEFSGQAIGRTTCSDCGWEHAEVRVNKAGRLWSHCDSCRSQHQTRTTKGSDALRAHMQPLLESPMATPEASDVTKPKPKPKSEPHHPLPPRRIKAAQQKAPKNGRETPPNDRSDPKPDRDPRTKDFWNDDFLGLGKLTR